MGHLWILHPGVGWGNRCSPECPHQIWSVGSECLQPIRFEMVGSGSARFKRATGKGMPSWRFPASGRQHEPFYKRYQEVSFRLAVWAYIDFASSLVQNLLDLSCWWILVLGEINSRSGLSIVLFCGLLQVYWFWSDNTFRRCDQFLLSNCTLPSGLRKMVVLLLFSGACKQPTCYIAWPLVNFSWYWFPVSEGSLGWLPSCRTLEGCELVLLRAA